MNNNIVAKDKKDLEKFMFDELEKLADIKEQQLKSYDRMMRENTDVNETKCRGRD